MRASLVSLITGFFKPSETDSPAKHPHTLLHGPSTHLVGAGGKALEVVPLRHSAEPHCAGLSWREDLRKTVKVQPSVGEIPASTLRLPVSARFSSPIGVSRLSPSFLSRKICVITCEKCSLN